MNKKETTGDILLADAILRLQAMQNILIKKGLFTEEEFKVEINTVSHDIIKAILQKANVHGDLDKLIENLNVGTKNIKEN